jgi:hypothetical protein
VPWVAIYVRVVSEQVSCLYISGKGGEEEKKHSDTHRVVSEQGIFLYIADRGEGRHSAGGLCNDCLQVGNDQENSQ